MPLTTQSTPTHIRVLDSNGLYGHCSLLMRIRAHHMWLVLKMTSAVCSNLYKHTSKALERGNNCCLSHLPAEMHVLQLADIGLVPLMGPPQTPATGQDTSCKRCLHLQLAAESSWW